MAKHNKSGKTNKNLLMHIKNNPMYPVKESTRFTEYTISPVYTDVSLQCENLNQSVDDLRNDRTETVKKIDISESRRFTSMVDSIPTLGKNTSVHEEASSSASSTNGHAHDKSDSGCAEKLLMQAQLRRTHTSLFNDNRITNPENTENVIFSSTRILFRLSNVQHFRTILSSSEQHSDSVSFQDVSTRVTSEYSKNLVLRSGLHKRKTQAKQLRRFKTNSKEDNRLASYEAQIEYVDKTHSQNRTQATKITGQTLGYDKSTKPQRNKNKTKTEVSSTKASISKPRAGADAYLITKSTKIPTKYSKNDATKSQLKSIRKQTPGHQSEGSLEIFKMMQDDEKQNKKVDFEEIPNVKLMAEMLESSGNGKKHGKSGCSVETIICLDISEAMKGPSWTKAITFAKNFIQEVKSKPCMDSRVFERIGLVTFGYETRVQVHLTREYHQVLSKLDTIWPNGPTRMRAGLKMCAAAIESAGGATILVNGMSVSPRIILITDGKTATNLGREGSDVSCTQDQDETIIMHTIQHFTKGCHVHIDCVPLGGGKLDFLTKIAQTTRGKIYNCEDWKKLGRRTKYLALASQHYDCFLRTGDDNFIRRVIRTHRNVNREDLDIIVESMRRSYESTEHGHSVLIDRRLSFITRPRMDLDLQWEDEDVHYIGNHPAEIGHKKNGTTEDERVKIAEAEINPDIVKQPTQNLAGKSGLSVYQDSAWGNMGAVIKRTRQARYEEVCSSNRKSHKQKSGMNGGYEFQLRDAEQETGSVETNKMDHVEVYDEYVKEMNRENIEISKLYITLPNPGYGDKESSNLKPEDNKVKMDAEVTSLDHNAKKHKNRRRLDMA